MCCRQSGPDSVRFGSVAQSLATYQGAEAREEVVHILKMVQQ